MRIALKELTTCGVQPGGEALELNFVDTAGAQVCLQVPFDHAQALVMTLPRLLDVLLKRITGNPQARYVFTLGRWSIENASEQNCLIATLSTDDGFEVSFGIPPEACRGLGWVLKTEADTLAPADEAARVPGGRDTACLN
jgi:hypothetical protein